jgi:hypothetical protein
MTPYLQETLKLVLAAFAVAQLIVLIFMVFVFDRNNKHEILLRIISVISGVLIYSIAVAFGIKFPEAILNTMYNLSINRLPPESGIYLIGLLFPAIVGIFISSSITNYIKNHNEIEHAGNSSTKIRWMCLIITIILLLYCDLFLYSYKEVRENTESFRPLLPNATFVLSVLLFAIFRFRPSKSATTTVVGPTDDRSGRSY